MGAQGNKIGVFHSGVLKSASQATSQLIERACGQQVKYLLEDSSVYLTVILVTRIELCNM